MQTFAEHPKTARRADPDRAPAPGRALFEPRSAGALALYLRPQRQGTRQTGAEASTHESTGEESPRSGLPFSRIPIRPRTAGVLQASLAVNAPGDVYEHEAEQVADRVTSMPQPQLRRKCACGGSCPACRTAQPHSGHEHAPAEPVASNDPGTTAAPALAREALSSAGRPLDSSTRESMEARFGHDFGQVRIHADPPASAAARGLAAQAFTVGEHIAFGDGRYAPASAAGRHLLAHELTHVLQQRAGVPALQRRAANCPASPPSPPTINTMADFIGLVRRVEASTPGGSDPIATARLISRTKYDGRAWDWMLPSTRGQAGVTESVFQEGEEGGRYWRSGGTVTAADVGSLCFKLIVTMPGGGQEDPMHLIAAIVADAETQAAGTGATGLSRLIRSLPASVSQRGASTWVGDVGKAAAYWMVDYPLRGGGTTKADYMREDASPHDLMADVDGVALTSRSSASGFAFDRARPLSENLQRFFNPAPRSGRERRFHVFCSAEGLALDADGVTLSAAARTTIGERVRDFAHWLHSADPGLVSHVTTLGQGTGYGLLVSRRASDWQWFADQFISFVQTNLTAEGP